MYALLRFLVTSQKYLSIWHEHITAHNIADLLHLAVNRTVRSWCPATHLLHSIVKLFEPETDTPVSTRSQLYDALVQPGLQESLLRTVLLREPFQHGVLSDLTYMPGMQGLPAAAVLSMFKEALTNGRHSVFKAMCEGQLAVMLDVQGLLQLLRLVLQRSDAAGFVYALKEVPAAQQLESGQVGVVVEGVLFIRCADVICLHRAADESLCGPVYLLSWVMVACVRSMSKVTQCSPMVGAV
jgi:hypothetical protein